MLATLDCSPRLVRPERHYPTLWAAAWWAQPTPEARRLALENKLDREQPLPTPSHGSR